MSTQRKPETAFDASFDNEVRDYLATNPEFFERHNELLNSLKLPHITGGAVSLVERQVSTLRQRDLKLERRLNELMEVARRNDKLAEKIHRLSLELLAAADLESTLSACEKTLRTAFDADQTVMLLFRNPDLFENVSAGRFFRPMERTASELKSCETFLSRGRPRCGQIRDTQRDFLFGEETDEIGSCALVPLGAKCSIGVLAIGSADEKRFHPAMSIDFIMRIGELISTALVRF
ncbi:MAG: DUF484 family protein [Pseudomonadota bacterium]